MSSGRQHHAAIMSRRARELGPVAQKLLRLLRDVDHEEMLDYTIGELDDGEELEELACAFDELYEAELVILDPPDSGVVKVYRGRL